MYFLSVLDGLLRSRKGERWSLQTPSCLSFPLFFIGGTSMLMVVSETTCSECNFTSPSFLGAVGDTLLCMYVRVTPAHTRCSALGKSFLPIEKRDTRKDNW